MTPHSAVLPFVQLAAQFDEAWNRRDAPSLAALFTKDADVVFHTGEVLAGRDAIERFYETLFPTIPAKARHSLGVRSVRLFQESTALVDCEVFITGQDPTDESRKAFLGLLTAVAVKQGLGWSVAAARLMIPIVQLLS